MLVVLCYETWAVTPHLLSYWDFNLLPLSSIRFSLEKPTMGPSYDSMTRWTSVILHALALSRYKWAVIRVFSATVKKVQDKFLHNFNRLCAWHQEKSTKSHDIMAYWISTNFVMYLKAKFAVFSCELRMLSYWYPSRTDYSVHYFAFL